MYYLIYKIFKNFNCKNKCVIFTKYCGSFCL